MDVEQTITWLMRYGHVVSGAGWLGGYAVLSLLIVPRLERDGGNGLTRLSEALMRFVTMSGTATVAFGAILIWRTRGYGQLGRGEWGLLILASIIISVLLLGMGDSALRPAIRRLPETGNRSTIRRLALTGLVLTILVFGLMTRALYAGN